MITTVTLNASIDKAYFMDRAIENGTVMRVAPCKNTAGGKGLNVARTVKLCGADVFATGFAGGFNGKYLEHLLTEDGIPHRFVEVAGETRSCINILDSRYHSTEYLEPGFELTEKDSEEFLRQFPELVKDSDVVTISGSIPKGTSSDIYFRLIQTAKHLGKKVLLDTSGEPLKQALKALPTLVKPNEKELEALFQTSLHTVDELIACGRKLFDMGIPYVVISLGQDGALLICEAGVYQGRPPKVTAVNTVGCGDSMVGAFAVSLERNQSPAEALRYAVAVSTAKAMSPDTGAFDPKQCEKLSEQITMIKLD